jgi:hypothetical protein
MIKRFFMCAVVTLAAGGAVAAIIVKAPIYLSRFNYH